MKRVLVTYTTTREPDVEHRKELKMNDWFLGKLIEQLAAPEEEWEEKIDDGLDFDFAYTVAAMISDKALMLGGEELWKNSIVRKITDVLVIGEA